MSALLCPRSEVCATQQVHPAPAELSHVHSNPIFLDSFASLEELAAHPGGQLTLQETREQQKKSHCLYATFLL